MTQALIYKEWIKTRAMLLVIILLSTAFTLYAIMQIQRVITIRGAAHLWEILLIKDNVFIESIQDIPLVSGALFAIAQFVPEMIRKRLKLTLHLPLSQTRISMTMLSYGAAVLVLLFGIQLVTLFVYLRSVLAIELVTHIIYTALPWFLAGISAYGLTAWICLEPTWTRRIVDTFISVGTLRLYFIASSPQAYNGLMIIMILFSFVMVYTSFISIHRFKAGIQ